MGACEVILNDQLALLCVKAQMGMDVIKRHFMNLFQDFYVCPVTPSQSLQDQILRKLRTVSPIGRILIG